MIKYNIPKNWINYDFTAIQTALVEAESAILALKSIPYQRSWVDKLQSMELKREVAGTSRIEGADFTDGELDEALKETPEQLLTRSQRQAHAAVQTYRWIAIIPDDRPLNNDLIKEMHRRIVTGADDDHCEPGSLRKQDENVHFGQPRHRGAEGGKECKLAFEGLTRAVQKEFKGHHPIIQALSTHYHLAAMHPFLDGNGRTARAIEALMLQRAGFRDVCFIAMSNYYYEEKIAYLNALAQSHGDNHDITPFLSFALRGIALQVNRLLNEIKINVQKSVFRNVMYDLFGKLETPRKRVIAERQLEILKLLLEYDKIEYSDLYKKISSHYSKLKKPFRALIRDLNGLIKLRAIKLNKLSDNKLVFNCRLDWPKEITETDFLNRMKSLPKAKS